MAEFLSLRETKCRMLLVMLYMTGIFLFCLQIFGVGSVAQMVLSGWKFGNFFSVNFSWGIGVTMGCYWAGGISGREIIKGLIWH